MKTVTLMAFDAFLDNTKRQPHWWKCCFSHDYELYIFISDLFSIHAHSVHICMHTHTYTYIYSREQHKNRLYITEIKMSSVWWNYCHKLYQKSSKLQPLVQPVTQISWHIFFADCNLPSLNFPTAWYSLGMAMILSSFISEYIWDCNSPPANPAAGILSLH